METNELLNRINLSLAKIDKIIKSKVNSSRKRRKIKQILEFINRQFTTIARVIASFNKLSYKKRIIDQVRPICNKILDAIKETLNCDSLALEHIYLVRRIFDCGCIDVAEQLVSLIMKKSERDIDLLSMLADITLEIGMIDVVLKIFKKLKEEGLTCFEIEYNEALIKYMMGDCEESLNILENIHRKYNKKSSFGLKIALLIALGRISDAIKLAKIKVHKN